MINGKKLFFRNFSDSFFLPRLLPFYILGVVWQQGRTVVGHAGGVRTSAGFGRELLQFRAEARFDVGGALHKPIRGR